MPTLNYKKQFAPLVVSGEKKQTIRVMRKRPFKVHDTLYHYTGLRTKQCQKLGESICLNVEGISVIMDDDQPIFWVEGDRLSLGLVDDLAIRDGFGSDPNPGAAMFRFFEERIPFYGQIIHWGALNE